MEINDLTEEQAKKLIKFIGKKANGDICIKCSSHALMFKPAKCPTYFDVGIDSDEYCCYGIESRYFNLKCHCKEPYKQILKAMFEVTCKFHWTLNLAGTSDYTEVMPKDKTLEEWLVQMDLES